MESKVTVTERLNVNVFKYTDITNPRKSYDITVDIFKTTSTAVPPVFILLHGFGASKESLKGHAQRISAKYGIAMYLPNMISLLGGGETEAPTNPRQLMNIDILCKHVEYIRSQSADYDGSRIIVGGHSAGGGITLEACMEMAKRGMAPLLGWIGLDAVGWRRTQSRALEFPLSTTPLISLRCDPNAWNKNGELRNQALEKLITSSDEGISAARSSRLFCYYLETSRHGDPLNPLPGGCIRVLGGSGLFSVRGASTFDRMIDCSVNMLLVGAAAGGVHNREAFHEDVAAGGAISVTKRAPDDLEWIVVPK